jgi:transposase InsO family protein
VLSIVKGETSAAEAVRKHGLDDESAHRGRRFTRVALAVHGAHSITASGVVDWPWGDRHGHLHIASGKPWQNGFGESFNSRLPDECLSEHEFWNLAHARVLLKRFRIECNTENLHSSLGHLTSEEFAAARPASA